MPPKSREATRQSSQQSTLSFHGKDRSKVTKPASPRNAKASKKDPALFEDISHTDVKTETDPDVDEPTTAEEVIKEQADESVKDPISTNAAIKTEDVLGGRAAESEVGATGGALGAGWEGNQEAEARKITETQIKRYWRAKDQERKAPRVHQEDLTVHEKILREWDMSGQYGVSSMHSIHLWVFELTMIIAMYRHSTTEALEAGEYAGAEATDGSAIGAVEEYGRWKCEVAEGACG